MAALKTMVRHTASAAGLVLFAGMVVAEDNNQLGGLEEIIVTARKQEENLQTVPIAVTVFNDKMLQTKGVDSIVGIANFAPNVTLESTAPISGASSALVAFIRGIGQSDFAINFEPGVGVYVDGVYYARTIGSVVDLMDVERIEVLKGPQGTLFGRNTIGGAINVTTRTPAKTFSAEGELTIGALHRRDVRTLINLPLGDHLAASIAFASRDRDGYVHRVPYPEFSNNEPSDLRYDGGSLSKLPNGNDLGNQNNQTLRAKLFWDPRTDLNVLLSVDQVRVRENSAPSSMVRIYPEGADGVVGTADDGLASLYNACAAGVGPPICNNVAGVGSLVGRTPYDTRFLTGNRFTTYGNGISGTYIDTFGAAATVTADISSGLTFKSITGYRELDSAFGEDADGSPLEIDHHGFVMKQHQVSEELQLNGRSERIDWTTGLYWFRERGSIHDLVPLGGGLLQVDGPNSLENQSSAAFGQMTMHVTQPWSITLGVRYTEERKQFNGGQHDRDALAFNLGLPLSQHPDPNDPTLYFPPGRLHAKFTNTSWRGGTEYRFTDSVFVYASYAEGFKSGGWDTRLTAPRLSVPGFAPELAKSYELGVKSQWLGNTLRVNVAGFHTDYQDLQLIIQQGISPLTRNAGKSKIDGAELELQWAPVDGLLLVGTYGWIDARYTQLDAAANASGIFLSNKFNNTPKNAYSLSADYTISMANGHQIGLHGNYSWRSGMFHDATNTAALYQAAYGLAGASLDYKQADSQWDIAVGGTNLGNQHYIVSGFNQPGVGYTIATQGAPREWWARLRCHF